MSNLVRKPGKSNLIHRPKHSYPDTMIGRPLEEEKNPYILHVSRVPFGEPQENAGVEEVNTELYRTGGKTRKLRKVRKARKAGKSKKVRKAKPTKKHNKRHSKKRTFRK
jgi:hypothetical protein